MEDTLTLAIEGMHCQACVRRVTDALQGVSGVQPKSVAVGSAQVAFNPDKTTPEEIAAAVNGIGFQTHIAE